MSDAITKGARVSYTVMYDVKPNTRYVTEYGRVTRMWPPGNPAMCRIAVENPPPGRARYVTRKLRDIAPAPAEADAALVYTVRDLSQQASSIMSEVENSGQPAFITRYGHFIAVITPLAPGQVESQVLAEMAHEITAQS